MRTILVTGTDTSVGKTWIASVLIRELRSHGLRTGAYKPVCSGAEFDAAGQPGWQDVESLRAACGSDVPADLVCPQRFIAPVAPNVAARMENRSVDNALLTDGLKSWISLVDWVVVEGAGGIFCPLSETSTVMDLATALQPTIIVVAANRLGVINHTRMTVESIQSRGLVVSAVVLNEISPGTTAADQRDMSGAKLPCEFPDDASLPSNAEQLQHWIPAVPLFHCAWNDNRLVRVPSATVPEMQSCGDSSDEASLVRLILKDQRGR